MLAVGIAGTLAVNVLAARACRFSTNLLTVEVARALRPGQLVPGRGSPTIPSTTWCPSWSVTRAAVEVGDPAPRSPVGLGHVGVVALELGPGVIGPIPDEMLSVPSAARLGGRCLFPGNRGAWAPTMPVGAELPEG